MQPNIPTGIQTTDAIVGQLACRCLCVIIPVFNEVRTVEQILQCVLEQTCVREVIIVDDASKDGSLDLIGVLAQHDPRIQVISHDQNRGKGAAIRSGLTLATSDVIVIQDADLEYDPRDYAKMLELILKGEADVVYGSRFASQANTRASLWHTLGNRCLTWCSNFASGSSLTDEATCYKMFRRNILQSFELVEDRFGFCPEFTAKISKLDLNIREVPISYRPRCKAEGKKIRLKDGFNALSCIVRYNFSFRRVRNGAERLRSI
jgi:glycosyltransferase involved in cell wall biosynthesis